MLLKTAPVGVRRVCLTPLALSGLQLVAKNGRSPVTKSKQDRTIPKQSLKIRSKQENFDQELAKAAHSYFCLLETHIIHLCLIQFKYLYGSHALLTCKYCPRTSRLFVCTETCEATFDWHQSAYMNYCDLQMTMSSYSDRKS